MKLMEYSGWLSTCLQSDIPDMNLANELIAATVISRACVSSGPNGHF